MTTIDGCIDEEKLSKSFKNNSRLLYVHTWHTWMAVTGSYRSWDARDYAVIFAVMVTEQSQRIEDLRNIWHIHRFAIFAQCTTARRHPRNFQASSPLSSLPVFSTWSDRRSDQWGVETRSKPTAEYQALFHGTDRWPDHAFVPSCMYLRQLTDRLCIGPIVTMDAAIGKFLCSSSASCNIHFVTR